MNITLKHRLDGWRFAQPFSQPFFLVCVLTMSCLAGAACVDDSQSNTPPVPVDSSVGEPCGSPCPNGQVCNDVTSQCEPLPATRPLEQLSSEVNAYNSFAATVVTGGPENTETTYVAWQECLFGDNCNKKTIRISKQQPNGTYGPSVEVSPVSDGSANAEAPSVIVDPTGTAHLVWVDDGTIGSRGNTKDVIYRTWDGTDESGLSEAKTLSHQATLGTALVANPSISLFENVPKVVFESFTGFLSQSSLRGYEVYLAEPDREGNWSVRQISDSTHDTTQPEEIYLGSTRARLAMDKLGGMHVVWQNQPPSGGYQLHYRKINTFGAMTGIEMLYSTPDSVAPTPAIVIGRNDTDSTIHVVWAAVDACETVVSGSSIQYASKVNDDEFSRALVISKNGLCSGQNISPSAAVYSRANEEDELVVTWASTNDVASAGSDEDIFLLRDPASAAAQIVVASEPAELQDNSQAASQFPSVSTGFDGTAFVCWHEMESESEGSDSDILCTEVVR